MAIRKVALPLYLLGDDEISGLIAKSMEIMTELAGESDTSELPPLVQALRDELALRGKPIRLNDDGTFGIDDDSKDSFKQ